MSRSTIACGVWLGLLGALGAGCGKPASSGEAEAGALAPRASPPAASPGPPLGVPTASATAAAQEPGPSPSGEPSLVASERSAVPDAGSPQQAARLTVQHALAQPSGATVHVEALYFGWQGPCRGEVPSRSAWQLADAGGGNSACVYVEGPLLRGRSPTAAEPVPVRVVGVLRELPGGGRYLDAERVEPR